MRANEIKWFKCNYSIRMTQRNNSPTLQNQSRPTFYVRVTERTIHNKYISDAGLLFYYSTSFSLLDSDLKYLLVKLW